MQRLVLCCCTEAGGSNEQVIQTPYQKVGMTGEVANGLGKRNTYCAQCVHSQLSFQCSVHYFLETSSFKVSCWKLSWAVSAPLQVASCKQQRSDQGITFIPMVMEAVANGWDKPCVRDVSFR